MIFPWDDSPSCSSTDNAVTVEDSTFHQVLVLFRILFHRSSTSTPTSTPPQLALLYAHHHAFLHTGRCPCHPEDPLVGTFLLPLVPQVLGNYRCDEVEVVEGGSGDWHYMYTSCLELTIEVRHPSHPPSPGEL